MGCLSIVTVCGLPAIGCVMLAGLWCHGVACLESTCIVDEVFDSATTASVGTGAFCMWKDDTTVLVTFGQGESSMNPVKSDYLSLTQVSAHRVYAGQGSRDVGSISGRQNWCQQSVRLAVKTRVALDNVISSTSLLSATFENHGQDFDLRTIPQRKRSVAPNFDFTIAQDNQATTSTCRFSYGFNGPPTLSFQ